MRAHTGRMVAVLFLCVAAVACGSSRPTSLSSRATTTSTAAPVAAPTSTSPSPAATTTEPPVVPTTLPPTTTVTVVAATAPPAPATTVPAVPAGLERVGSARQAILVSAGGYGATTAEFTAYERGSNGWEVALGPWTSRVGYNGVAPPGAKREGDGRTPSGLYGFDFMFGVSPDPGVSFPYRRVTSSIVWDDDPDSPLYNQWVDRNQQDPGADPEEMYQPQAYAYGAVIAYNASATPGLGSAIFLHASTGGATSGCVSLPLSQLVEVLRWLDPGQAPRIVIGVE